MIKKDKPAKKSNPAKNVIKRVLREAILVLVGGGLLLAISGWIGGFAEEVTQESNQIKNEAMQKTAEIQALQARMAQFNDALPVWNGFKNKTGDYNLNLSRDEATNVFMELRDQYAFKDIRVTVAPIAPSGDPNLIKSRMQVNQSDITINMRAYTDEQIVQFLDNVRERLSGIVKIKSLKLTRSKSVLSPNTNPNLDPNAEPVEADPNAFDQALIEPQLDVVISLVWYGISEVPTAVNPNLPPGAIP